MSLPPVTVKIKRKATDDPVEFLRIHESRGNGKRQRQDSRYVFSRQPAEQCPASQPGSLDLRKIQQLPHSSSSPARHAFDVAQTAPSPSPASAAQAVAPPSTIPSEPAPSRHSAQEPIPVAQPRRYHIYRDDASSGASPGATQDGRKRKAETVFVERRIPPKSPDGSSGVAAHAQGTDSGAENSDAKGPDHSGQTMSLRQADQPSPQKKPGKKARTTIALSPSATAPATAPAPLRNVVMPSGLTMAWDVTSDQLAAEMQAYTLQEIGKNLAEAEAARPKPVRGTRAPSKFKPKKPAKRCSERHPEARIDRALDVEEEYVDVEMDDDAEYIIDTYVRVPAEAMESHQSIGLLILESQPDIDEFYRGEEESSEEEDCGDEDENAENHYTADYPDEEVDSDDEHGRNAYNYRTGNASDLEEYDEHDAMFSDDENEATRYPWMTKQPPRRGKEDEED